MRSTIQVNNGGPRGYPIREAFERIGLRPTKGQELVNTGELETYLIGNRRFATAEAIERVIKARIAATMNESPEDRANKVAKAVAGRAKQRSEAAA